MNLLPAVELTTGDAPDAAVIWLHGLGADGNDFAPVVPALRLPESLQIRFIFPHAPAIPVTVNGGFVMPAWFDIMEMKVNRRVDSQQLLASAEKIRLFVHREIGQGIDSRRIVLAGFSQGGAVAYQLALTHDQPLGGLLAMSSYFATSDSIQASDANREIPIAIQHGIQDPVVPIHLAQRAVEVLEERGYAVTYQDYPMEHSVCPRQIVDIGAWLVERLAG